MSFANPLLLLGLLGAAVPVLIHLIHRRRPRTQPFPAMQLLLASIQRVERRWRVRRFLLLALRVLLLAALALAAAGPLVGEDRDRASGRIVTGPERLALVIDASLSMRAVYGDRSVFARALAEARERIDRLGPEDQALIVVTGTPPRVPLQRPTRDRGALLGVLADLEPGWRPNSLAEAISTAAGALGRPGKNEEKTTLEPPTPARIIVLSDLARPAVDGAAALEVDEDGTLAKLEVVDLLPELAPEARDNHGFVSALATSVPDASPRTVEVLGRVQSYASRPREDPVPRDLTLATEDRELVRGVVEVVPGALAQKAVRYAFERSGVVPCRLELEPDALVEDDVRFVAVEVKRQVHVLIVDGDPSGIAKEDEVFYLERALEAGASDQPVPRTISADDLPRTDLEPFEVVVLAGVPTISRTDGERLARFVEGGGGLWISAAEGMDVQAWSMGLDRILPRRLRGLKQIETGRPGLAFGEPRLSHPVMRLFEGPPLGGLLSTETRGFLLLEPAAGRPTTTLLELEGGAPALVVANAGKGRVALLTTSVDRDLTDLPIRPAFVPLVRQLILFLADALSEPVRRQTLVGQARDIEVPEGASRLEVRDPEGRLSRFGPEDWGDGRLRFTGTRVPGVYRVQVGFGATGALEPFDKAAFAVNVDPVESDLRPVEAKEAALVLRGEASLGEGALAVAGSAIARRLDSEGISRLLLVLMGLAFLLESALTAVRVGR